VREEYTILFEGLASCGYLVITMDHIYNAALVEFPDETIIFSIPTLNGNAQSLDVRTKDSSFVIEQLSNTAFVTQIPGIAHRDFKSSKIAMLGHSFGGTTTLSALGADKRVLGGVSLDGPPLGNEITLETKSRFFCFEETIILDSMIQLGQKCGNT